ncbi:MAG: carbohydrate-binding family 9-like protein, partial [Victivallales bacterium]|nr:carbohydrate-binding family 9-like protein [Victivallales bacterium]
MRKAFLFLLLSCFAVHAWIPMAVVPPNGNVSLGRLPTIAGDAMPTAATIAFISRDATSIIFNVICFESKMDKLAANAKTRDSQVWSDDCVELFIQPKGWKDYAHVVVNSVGTVFDELTRDVSWNADAIKAVCKTAADRWTATVSIPLDALGGVPKDGDEWRVNICRSRVATPELSTWSPSVGGFHNPSAFGLIRFSNEPYPKDFSWKLTQRGQGRVALAWSSNEGITTTLDGKALPPDGSFTYSLVQNNKLYLESKHNGRSIFRALLPIPVNPLEQLVHAAEANLEGLASPEATALSAEIRTLKELLGQIPPDKQSPLQDTIATIVAKSRNLKVKADFMAKNHSASEIPYGVETSLVKLLKHSPFNGEIGGTVRLDAARNEMDAAQIALFANDFPLLLTEAKLDGDLKTDNGKILPASALRLRRVGYINTNKPVYKVEHVGLWPDPLMDLAPFDIAAGSFETVWLDVRVPDDQPAALYKGSVTVTAMNGSPTKVPVEVRVRNFTIPRKSSIISAFGMSPNWRVPQDRAAYLDNLLEHRITPYTCVSAPKLISLPTLNWTNAQKLTVTVTPKQPAELQGIITLRDKPSANLPHRALPAGKTTVIDFPKE